jgi:hypothetical protein
MLDPRPSEGQVRVPRGAPHQPTKIPARPASEPIERGAARYPRRAGAQSVSVQVLRVCSTRIPRPS